MKTKTHTVQDEVTELRPVAQRVFWWLSPEEALGDPVRFVAQVMTFGNWEDVQKTRGVFGEETFRAALENPPPGVFDEKSWHYWHAVFHVVPVPPLPKRKL